MKVCCRCKVSKTKADFNKKSANRDGLERYCKDCHRVHTQAHYKANKKTYKVSAKKFKHELKEWYVLLKQKYMCKKCKEHRHWRLAFHHRNPKTKVKEVSQMITDHASRQTILKEIKKCDALCHNCHSDVHYFANRRVAQLVE